MTLTATPHFVRRAADLLENAEDAAARGEAFAEMTVLVDSSGGLRLIANSDWPLDSLALHHGARAAYRVGRDAGSIRVQALEGGRTCIVQSADPAKVARRLLGD